MSSSRGDIILGGTGGKPSKNAPSITVKNNYDTNKLAAPTDPMGDDVVVGYNREPGPRLNASAILGGKVSRNRY